MAHPYEQCPAACNFMGLYYILQEASPQPIPVGDKPLPKATHMEEVSRELLLRARLERKLQRQREKKKKKKIPPHFV